MAPRAEGSYVNDKRTLVLLQVTLGSRASGLRVVCNPFVFSIEAIAAAAIDLAA